MKKTLIFLVIFSLCSVSLWASDIIVSQSGEKTHFSLTGESFPQEGTSYMDFECHIKSIGAEDITTQKGNFTRVDIEGFHHSRKLGEPQLPVISQIIEVPIGTKVSAKILSKDEYTLDLPSLGYRNKVFPAQPSARKTGKKPEFAYKSDAYKKPYSKSDLISLKEIGVVRNYRIFLLKVAVTNYSSVENKMLLYNNVKVRVYLENANWKLIQEFKQRYASTHFDQICNKAFITSKSLAKLADAKRNTVKYLIVSDPMFRGELNRFIDHKKGLGYKVVVKFTDEIGSTTTSIQNAIKSEYQSPSDGIVPTFVLLVGDREQIPAFSGTEGSYITDLNYATTSGNDYLPDVMIGRFSAQNVSQLTPQIDKTVDYEAGNLLSYDFLRKPLLVAGWDSYWASKRGYPHIRYGLQNYFHSEAGYEKLSENTFLSSGSHQNESAIRAAVNAGVGVFNYTAHGTETSFHDPGFRISDIQNLNNNGMYPVIIGNCCLTNSFEVSNCFGEAWLRKANGGAVGFIGGSSYTYWDEDLWWGVGRCAITGKIDNGQAPSKAETGVGAYDTAFEKLRNFCNYGAMLAGNLAVQEADSHLTKYYFEVYHLMGDPGLPAYWATPNETP